LQALVVVLGENFRFRVLVTLVMLHLDQRASRTRGFSFHRWYRFRLDGGVCERLLVVKEVLAKAVAVQQPETTVCYALMELQS
jgi:hypothetical protein